MGRGAGEGNGVRENGSWSRATFSSSSCVSCGHICLEEGKPFSLQHKKGTVGQAGLQQGGWGLRWSAGRSGKTKRPTRPTFKELEKNKGTNRESRRLGIHLPWRCLRDIRLSPAVNDSDGVTGLHPQSTWLCDLPHTAPLRKPSLWRQKKGWLSFWPES